ncbi:alpha/beta hydrolase [Streptomyces sp. NPDC102360]|uniref:alpha/beta hydrolase n=1 Tax=Streptomyces sp. NPDC102360 TaxID=3366160 RepID=UPI003805D233
MRRFRTLLTTAVLATLVVGGTAGWASAGSVSAPNGPVQGTAAWLADDTLGRQLPDPATATPSEVAAFFAGLTDAQRQRLVAGDLEHATHVAVIVPGSDVDASRFDRTAQRAADLQAKAGDDTAVIAWAGYTTPSGVGLDQATGRLADSGAERLPRLTEGLDATGLPDPALFCHSYGSVVCGLAAPDTDASDIVVMGSPGMRADDVTALRTDAHVWAAKSAHDWIDRVPNVEVLGLSHGADPTSPGFGATALPADDVPAHDEYFAPGTSTLTAFAAIADGELR